MAKPEQKLHRAVADFLTVALRSPTIWTTIPAGGGGKTRGAILKAMGLHKGWPDLIIMHPGQLSIMSTWDRAPTKVIGIELKAKTKLSPSQKEVALGFKACNADYRVCHSVAEVESVLKSHGIPLHARLT